MYKSEQFGRIFWIDENNDFKSCPLNVDGTGDFNNEDYVSEWNDFTEVNIPLLLNIHKTCIINKNDYNNSLSLSDSYVREVV